MELIKNTQSKSQFKGLGLLVILAVVVTFAPFVYFLISWALGDLSPVAGGVVK